MELQASRTTARRGPTGAAVLLSEQDRSLWDHAQIERGMAALQSAQKLGGGAHSYALQAAIAACHARANSAAETDWERIVLLYDALLQISPSPIVALNRAVAVGDGARAVRWTPCARCSRGRACAGQLSSAAQRQGRSACEAGTICRSARRDATRDRNDGKRSGARIAVEKIEAGDAPSIETRQSWAICRIRVRPFVDMMKAGQIDPPEDRYRIKGEVMPQYLVANSPPRQLRPVHRGRSDVAAISARSTTRWMLPVPGSSLAASPRPQREVAAGAAQWRSAHHRRPVSGSQGAHRRLLDTGSR